MSRVDKGTMKFAPTVRGKPIASSSIRPGIRTVKTPTPAPQQPPEPQPQPSARAQETAIVLPDEDSDEEEGYYQGQTAGGQKENVSVPILKPPTAGGAVPITIGATGMRSKSTVGTPIIIGMGRTMQSSQSSSAIRLGGPTPRPVAPAAVPSKESTAPTASSSASAPNDDDTPTPAVAQPSMNAHATASHESQENAQPSSNLKRKRKSVESGEHDSGGEEEIGDADEDDASTRAKRPRRAPAKVKPNPKRRRSTTHAEEGGVNASTSQDGSDTLARRRTARKQKSKPANSHDMDVDDRFQAGPSAPDPIRPSQRLSQAPEHNSSSEDEIWTRPRRVRPRVDRAVSELPPEGPPLDETTMTMHDLCNGIGQGRHSSQFLEMFKYKEEDTKEKREAMKNLREAARRKELGMPREEDGGEEIVAPDRTRLPTAKEVFESATPAISMAGSRRRTRQPPRPDPSVTVDQDDGDEYTAEEKAEMDADPDADADLDDDDKAKDDDDYDDDYAGVTLPVHNRAIQMRLGPTGLPVIDQQTIEYDRFAGAEDERARMVVVDEGLKKRFVNASTYAKKPRAERWSKEEGLEFERGLRMFGLDFNMITRLLPGRTRTMVKNKFKKEDKLNPQHITHLLSKEMRLSIDLNHYGKTIGRDLSGPAPDPKKDFQDSLGLLSNERSSAAPVGLITQGAASGEDTDGGNSSAKGRARIKKKSRSRSMGRASVVSEAPSASDRGLGRERGPGPHAIAGTTSVEASGAEVAEHDATSGAPPRAASRIPTRGLGMFAVASMGQAPARTTDD